MAEDPEVRHNHLADPVDQDNHSTYRLCAKDTVRLFDEEGSGEGGSGDESSMKSSERQLLKRPGKALAALGT